MLGLAAPLRAALAWHSRRSWTANPGWCGRTKARHAVAFAFAISGGQITDIELRGDSARLAAVEPY